MNVTLASVTSKATKQLCNCTAIYCWKQYVVLSNTLVEYVSIVASSSCLFVGSTIVAEVIIVEMFIYHVIGLNSQFSILLHTTIDSYK